MLQSLTIKNFAIIENTSLNFDLGFNVLIGETGAGKSIIFDALRFVLGEKANKDNIRSGCTQLSVKAVFSNLSKNVLDKLSDFQIDCDDVLIVSRTYNTDGKSSCLINGEPVTVAMLKQIGDLMYDIYGQNDGTSLLNVKNHLKIMDMYNAKILEDDKLQIKNQLARYKEIEYKISSIGGQGENRERLIDLLKYQINEIESLNLKNNEDIELEQQINSIANFEKLSSNLENCYTLLSDNNLSTGLNDLESILDYAPTLKECYNRLQSSIIEIDDIKSEIKEYLSNLSSDDVDIDELNERLDKIKFVKKKYGPTIQDVFDFLEKSKNQLDDLLNGEEKLAKLTSQKQKIREELYNSSLSLHKKRVELSKEIETKVQNELKTLGMKNTVFSIKFDILPDIKNAEFTLNGLDKVEFLFSANIGESQKSLSKTISGGEMSRFMLALKNVFNQSDDVSLLVFDEIDSGVSGEIGLKVGQKLALLSKNYQILCITHLAQVTALADKFIYIKKFVENNVTKSVATYLDEKQLLVYLSSLYGSITSDISIMHAQELLNLAKDYKNTLNK